MRALITGVTGQDGSYLAELLLSKGYEVCGLYAQRHDGAYFPNLQGFQDQITLIPGDLTDASSIRRALDIAEPDEVYNLAAQSFVKASWDMPEHTTLVNGIGVLHMLEGIRQSKGKCRFYQASTSEMFGKSVSPQSEMTVFHPRSPYGVSKLYGHWITVNYRESYGMFACSGILFNHESPRRGEQFVTQKIAKAVANIKLGKQSKLELGNLDAKRDIGHAADYVEAMWLMMQQPQAEDYVISTGITHSIQDMLDVCFGYVGLSWHDYVVQNPAFMRPAEVDLLLGDSTKARKKLGWNPQRTFIQIMQEMVEANLVTLQSLNQQKYQQPSPIS